MSQAANGLFNLLTIIFVALTIVAVVVVASILNDSMEPPSFLAPEETAIVPTLAMLASPTPWPSWTPSLTPLPSNTPSPTPSHTPPPTATNTATATPTITETPAPTSTSEPTHTYTPVPTNTRKPPTPTPTVTLTPTPTTTLTFTPSPTGPTPTPTNTLSPYPFIVQPLSLILRENYANAAGCNWQGVAGQVTTDRGEAVVGIQVRVYSEGVFEQFTVTGTNQFYGPSGWEIVVDSQPNNGRYKVELWNGQEQVSPTVEIVFPGTCQQNLATVNFIQTRPF